MNLTRKLYQSGLAFPGDLQNQVNWLVLWRRTVGGLSAAHQHEIRNYLGGIGIGRKKSGTRLNAQLERDGWRLLASLEHLSGATRAALGGELLRKLKKEPDDSAWLWSLGRFGARIPLYGSLACVVPTETAEEWISALLDLRDLKQETAKAISSTRQADGGPNTRHQPRSAETCRRAAESCRRDRRANVACLDGIRHAWSIRCISDLWRIASQGTAPGKHD